MNKKLKNAFNKMEATKGELFEIISQYSEEQQRFRPSVKEWSMLDVVEHLAEVEAGVNRLIQSYPPNQSTKKLTFKNYIYCWLFQGFFILPFKVKAPAMLKPPQSDLSLNEWSIKWNKERKVFQGTVENLSGTKLDIMAFKHPVAGAMNMFHTILFQTNHIKHHLHQIKRISKSKDFPK
jgi:hypothetical protein